MTKEKVQNKVPTIQWLKKKYTRSTNNPMTKEKVQNKVQTIQWLKKKYKMYKQSND